VPVGLSDVRAVVRDAFGREQTLGTSSWFTSGLLRQGTSDYSYSAGFRRLDAFDRSFDYGPPALIARHRLGVADRLTLGARFEAARSMVSGGASATYGSPFGELEVAAAASRQGQATAAAASLGYSLLGRTGSIVF